ncbi:TPA: MBL fold metallo-hydrolase [Candidatus Bipolaricaulota bacterium]|nr:MBL fold metallo-hydrolase [Candidatus Bipolaricaulota bacterium]
MKVIVLGSGSPIPYEERAQSGVLLLRESHDPLLVDCGSGVLDRLGRLNLEPETETDVALQAINEILLTHHHLDHMADLLPLLKARWLLGRRETRIFGPEGTEALLDGLLELYPYLKGEISVDIVELAEGEEFELAGLRVATLRTVHQILNLAYKFAEGVVISGDTEPFPGMGEFAEGCSLVIHECSFPDGFSIPGHSTPYALGEVLAGREIGTLVLTHLYPQAIAHVSELVEDLREGGFGGRVEVARDLDCFQIEIPLI